jgi:hypothetical protein
MLEDVMEKEKPFEDVMEKLKQFENVMGKIKPKELNATPTTKDEIEAKKQKVSLETQLHELKESLKKEESRSNLETELYEGTFADQPIQTQRNWGCILGCILFVIGVVVLSGLIYLFAGFPLFVMFLSISIVIFSALLQIKDMT